MIITAVLVVLGTVGTVFVVRGKINSDMLEYLPKNTATSDGIEFLKKNFDVEGDAFVVVEGYEKDPELEKSISKMKKEIAGITQFVWYGDVKMIDLLKPLLGETVNTEELKSYLRRPITDENGEIVGYNYILLVLFEYSPSTQEAFNVHKQIRAELHDNLGRETEISGMTALADTVFTETIKEVPLYLLFSVLIVLVILLISLDSFMDPVILMITMGVAIIINMGSNLILPQISIISFAASSVLQLGITMDYAIFLMNAYKEERVLFEPTEAVKRAVPRTTVNVLASSLTTIGGFAALYFMRFTIGTDLANVIIKGIVLSLVTVIVLQPCLLIYFDRATKKLSHKKLDINVEPVVKGVLKGRYVIAAVAVLLLVPAFFGQHFVKFSYLKVYDTPKEMSSQKALAESLQNQIIMAVPLETKNGSHKEFMEELLSDEKIGAIVSAFSVLDIESDKLLEILGADNMDSLIATVPTLNTLFRRVETDDGAKWYTLYLVEIEGDTEDEGAFATISHLNMTLDYYFTESYPLGVLTGVGDMAGVTPGDFLRVTLVSAGIILLIMSLLLKSVRKSFLMVVLIELAVWLNITINTLAGEKINFMIYIIISSVQLGCTVDYAILLSTRFEEAKREFSDTKTAITKATASAFPAITVSASIIAAVCLAIFFVSNNLLVKEMAALLARGAAISYALVILVLPCLLVFFKKMDGDNRLNIWFKKLFKGKTKETEVVCEENNGIPYKE